MKIHRSLQSRRCWATRGQMVEKLTLFCECCKWMISFMFYCLFVKHFIKMLCYVDPSQFEIQINWVVSIAERSFWTDHARLLRKVITTDDIVTFPGNRFVALMKLLIFAQYSLLLTILKIFSDFEQNWKNTFLQKVRFFIYDFFIFK